MEYIEKAHETNDHRSLTEYIRARKTDIFTAFKKYECTMDQELKTEVLANAAAHALGRRVHAIT